jgi:hypothetical protein
MEPRDSASPKPREALIVNFLDIVARGVETPPWPAAYRLVIGFCLVPLFAWWRGDQGSDWRLLPLFLLVLLALRLVPAILRRVLPVSDDLQTHWARQRFLAKRVDSYQWRKLVCFGLGLAAYLAVVGRADVIPAALAIACLLAGGLGAWRWRRLARSEPVIAALVQRGHRSSPLHE